MTKVFRFFAALLLLPGCAHSHSDVRTPANISTVAPESAGASNMFKNTAVTDAVLLSDADANGARKAICKLNARGGRRDLVPAFMQPEAAKSESELGLRDCDPAESRQVTDLAEVSHRPQVAGAPLLIALCAIDFGLTAYVTASLNTRRNEDTLSKNAEYRDQLGLQAGLAATSAGKVMSAINKNKPSSLNQMRNVGLRALGWTVVCAGAGYAVGYYLVPLK